MRVSSPTPVNEATAGSLLCFLLTMSNIREVARYLNALVRESRVLFGNYDSHALTEFITEYLCGDNPIDSDDK